DCARPRAFRRLALLDDLDHVAQMAVCMLVRQVEAHAAAVDAAAVRALDVYRDVAQPEIRDEAAQPLGIEAEVDQCPERHVSADAGEPVEKQGAAGVVRRGLSHSGIPSSLTSTAAASRASTCSRPCTRST